VHKHVISSPPSPGASQARRIKELEVLLASKK